MLDSLVLGPLRVFLFLRILHVMCRFQLARFAEPLIFGDYPKCMRDLVKERLPTFSEREKKMIKGTMDFIGINCYTSTYAANAPPPKQYPSHSVDSLSTTNCKLDISYLYIYRILTNKQQEVILALL